MTLNRVIIAGNLTKDPELRQTGTGKKLSEISLAINRHVKAEAGREKDDVCFVNIVVWNKQAEALCEHCKKGSKLFIEGRLQYDSWEKDGQKHNMLKVSAERVQFLNNSAKQNVQTQMQLRNTTKVSSAHEDEIPF